MPGVQRIDPGNLDFSRQPVNPKYLQEQVPPYGGQDDGKLSQCVHIIQHEIEKAGQTPDPFQTGHLV